MADCCDNLKLGSSFIDGCDTGIAVNAFAGIILHEAGTAMDLDCIVGILVAIFAAKTFCKRSACIGQFGVGFCFLTLFRSQRAFFCDVIVDLVDINKTRCLI